MKIDKPKKFEKPECDFSIELLSAYIDNELTESERQIVESHIKTCAICQQIVEQFKAIDASIRELEFEEPSREFVFNLKKNVMERLRKKKSPVIWKFLPIFMPVAAATILVILITGHEELERPVGMKNKVEFSLALSEPPVQTDKIDVVVPKPGIVAKTSTVLPSTPRATEKKVSADRQMEAECAKEEVVAPSAAGVVLERADQGVVRAIIDSTGRVLNVATGNTITPEEDTTISRLLKGQQLAPPTIRGKPKQMFVEFVPEQKDSN
ncbi:MAG: anti-sigma factor [candidate division WOR-3 bacterium]